IVTDAIEPREKHVRAADATLSRKTEPADDGSIDLTSDAEDSATLPVQEKTSVDYLLKAQVYATMNPATQPTSKPSTQLLGAIATGPMKLSIMRDGVVVKIVEIDANKGTQ